MKVVLYIHGMGGGGDSRIPSILSEELSCYNVKVIVRTYDFDPETGAEQIASWVEEQHPALIVGESLGALQALRIKGLPHLYVSPALNTPFYFELLSWLTLIPGVTWVFDKIYKPREGDRQPIHFTFTSLRKYLPHRKKALECAVCSKDIHHAFFGTDDHYRNSGIVSIRTWRKHFGDTFTTYEGSHYMEEAFVRSILVDKILGILDISK